MLCGFVGPGRDTEAALCENPLNSRIASGMAQAWAITPNL
jgi:hypothetical protein